MEIDERPAPDIGLAAQFTDLLSGKRLAAGCACTVVGAEAMGAEARGGKRERNRQADGPSPVHNFHPIRRIGQIVAAASPF